MLREPFVSHGRAIDYDDTGCTRNGFHARSVSVGPSNGGPWSIAETRIVAGGTASSGRATAWGRSTTRRKIVHVITSVDPAWGGPATVVTRLAAAQAAAGNDVMIISALRPERREVFGKASASIPNFHKVKLSIADSQMSLRDLLRRNTWKNLDEAIKSADFVHLHGVWDMILVAASRIARKHRIPYVLRPCGMLDPWCLKQHALRKKIGMMAVYRRMLNSAAFLHVLNTTESDLIEPLKLSVPRKIVPNGVFLEETRGMSSDESFLEKFPQLQGKRFILFLSRLHHKKGLDLLAKAFIGLARLQPDVHLVVAGEDSGAKAPFEAQIREAGLEHRVHVVGGLYGTIKRSALQNAACFCLPSYQEGFSLAVTEALANGLPVAISKETHFPEVSEVGAGIEYNLKVPEIVAALDKILNSTPEQRKEMAAAGKSLIATSFNWPRIAEQTCDLYSQVIAAGRKSRGVIEAVKRNAVPAARAAAIAIVATLLAASRSISS